MRLTLPTAPTERKEALRGGEPIEPIAERFPALEEKEIELTFYAPGARSAQVAGNFNGWRPEATPMSHPGTGGWSARLQLKSGQ